jgi:hypothetical protein
MVTLRLSPSRSPAKGATETMRAKAIADATKIGIALRVDDAGDLGRAIELLSEDYVAEIEANRALLKSMQEAKSLITTQHGRMSDKAGTPLDSPLISIPLQFGKFSEKMIGANAGKPRALVYDWATRTVDGQGREHFEQRLGADGKPINNLNFADIVKAGDVIRRIALEIESVVVGQMGISLRWSIRQLHTERPSGDSGVILVGQEDEDPVPVAPVVVAPAKPVVVAPVVQAKPVAPAAVAAAVPTPPKPDVAAAARPELTTQLDDDEEKQDDGAQDEEDGVEYTEDVANEDVPARTAPSAQPPAAESKAPRRKPTGK